MERVVSNLTGVNDGVINEIEVKPSRTAVSAEIKTGIEAPLKIRGGSTVVLTGSVYSWPERNAAERAARRWRRADRVQVSAR